MATIDISGLNKAEVLAALYNNSKTQGMGVLHYTPEPMTIQEATEALSRTASFDYLNGRVMKVSLVFDTVDTWGYDRDNGEGAAYRAISHLVKQEPT